MQLGDNAPDIAAENFVEICVAEATIEEQYFESESKIQLSFFLMKLLNEFKHQEISNAVDAQAFERIDRRSLHGFMIRRQSFEHHVIRRNDEVVPLDEFGGIDGLWWHECGDDS